MATEADKHFELVHLNIICNQYERYATRRAGAVKQDSRQACLVKFLNPVTAMQLMVDSADRQLRMNLPRGKAPGSASQAARRAQQTREAAVETTPGLFSASCIDTDPTTDAASLNLTSPGLSVTSPEFNMVTDVLSALGIEGLDLCEEEIADLAEKCFDCDLRVQFDWQIKPINLLAGLEGLLKDIEALIDQIMGFLDPFNLLEDLCDLFDGFEIFCIPDLIMLLVALQLLIKKYMTFSFELMLDWTMIVGPLLKLITDLIAGLLEQLIALIVAPLDCILGALRQVDELVDAFADTIGTMAAAGQAFGDTFSGGGDGNIPGLAGTTNVAPTSGVTWEGGDADGTDTGARLAPGSMGEIFEGTNPVGDIGGLAQTGGSEFSPTDIIGQSAANTSAAIGAGAGAPAFGKTGFTLTANDTLGKFLKKQREGSTDENGEHKPSVSQQIKDLNPIKQAILAVQEVKQWITQLLSNILFAIKSLNAFVTGGLSLNCEAMGIIMMVLQLIAFINLIIKLKSLGVNGCEELKNNPEALKQALSITYPNATLDRNGNVITVTDPTDTYRTNIDPTQACSLPKADENMVREKIISIIGSKNIKAPTT